MLYLLAIYIYLSFRRSYLPLLREISFVDDPDDRDEVLSHQMNLCAG